VRNLLILALLLCSVPAWATTWFVRQAGGTRYDATHTSGQCSGLADADYPGTGTNQACAFSSVQYLYSDGTYGVAAWVGTGGDTYVIRGCAAFSGESNPSPPNCRVGWVTNTGSGGLCAGITAYYGCSIPPPPSGTSGNPTKILGGCAYGTYTCTPVTSYPYASNNLTQIFGGMNVGAVLWLYGSQYVTIEGIEITTHNGACSPTGSPAYPAACSNSSPVSDYAKYGILTNNQTSNIVLQDVYIHGMAVEGIGGPIGGPFTLTRVSNDFNAFAGWNFDDTNSYFGNVTSYSITSNVITLQYTNGEGFSLTAGQLINLSGFGTSTFLNGQAITLTSATSSQMVASFTHANTSATESGSYANGPTPDASGSTITQSYMTMVGNGCLEQYPISNTAFPAKACWDSNSAGFGDSWSGQNSELDTFTCDHCAVYYNVKDAAMGPHTLIKNLSVTNSIFYGNMGQQGKWGTTASNTTLFQNNLYVGDCQRMSTALPGAAQNFNQTTGLGGSYLTNYCRAAGDLFDYFSDINSTVNFNGNTFIGYNATILNLGFATVGQGATSPYNFTDNSFLGYSTTTGNYPNTGQAPGLFYKSESSVTLVSSYNAEYGTRNDNCDGTFTGTHIVCTDPAFVSEPAQGAYPPDSVFDSFNFHPTSGSPLRAAGTTISGMTTDYYGVTRPSPPGIGGVEYSIATSASFSGGYISGGVVY